MAAICVRTCICHAKRTTYWKQIIHDFIFKWFSPDAFSTSAISTWISTLYHKLVNYPMHGQPIIISFFCVGCKIFHCFRCFFWEHFYFYITKVFKRDCYNRISFLWSLHLIFYIFCLFTFCCCSSRIGILFSSIGSFVFTSASLNGQQQACNHNCRYPLFPLLHHYLPFYETIYFAFFCSSLFNADELLRIFQSRMLLLLSIALRTASIRSSNLALSFEHAISSA